MDGVAFLVGIEIYDCDKFTTLPEANYDVLEIEKKLEHRASRYKILQVFKGRVNSNELKRNLESFLNEQRGDALIYFSGHGYQVVDRSGQVAPTGYLATSDCKVFIADDQIVGQDNGFALSYLNQLIQGSSLRSLVLLLDACHSGNFLENTVIKNSFQRETNLNYHIIASCRGSQSSYIHSNYSIEQARTEQHLSIFTDAVIKGLSKENSDENGQVTSSRLYQLVEKNLKQSQYKQQPIQMMYGDSTVVLMKYHLSSSAEELEKGAEFHQGFELPSEEQKTSFRIHQQLVATGREGLTSISLSKHGISISEFNVIQVDAVGQQINQIHTQIQFITEQLDNEIALDMVIVPGGKFLMGALSDEHGRFDDELPQRSVAVNPFLLSKYPITQSQWYAIALLPKINRDLSPNPSKFKKINQPVEQVSWYDALEFCARLSIKTGYAYRLPNEAEWEYSCRAGTETPFFFGSTITPRLANYDGRNSYAYEEQGIFRQQTTPVGSYNAPNLFGLHDMHGNVWEWCADPWHNNYQGAPLTADIWTMNGDPSYRVIRGGSWNAEAKFCRSASRGKGRLEKKGDGIGFRVARYF